MAGRDAELMAGVVVWFRTTVQYWTCLRVQLYMSCEPGGWRRWVVVMVVSGRQEVHRLNGC